MLRGCSHKDIKTQDIARHDKAMRALLPAFTKGKDNSYLSMDCRCWRAGRLKIISVHCKRVYTCILPGGDRAVAMWRARQQKQDQARYKCTVIVKVTVRQLQYFKVTHHLLMHLEQHCQHA